MIKGFLFSMRKPKHKKKADVLNKYAKEIEKHELSCLHRERPHLHK